MSENRSYQNPSLSGSAASGRQKVEADPEAGGAARFPSISLPKGGGAIRGIGEKFTANPVTGTGSITLPLAISPGRSGFGPQLSLAYDSGAGNGPFGFGWSLSLPAITRKTDKGLPQYRDSAESDIFILSGAEDLVPVLESDGVPFHDETSSPGYSIHRYRPRIEGLFARVERWTNLTTREIHWRSISRDNITTIYGKTLESRIADPDDLLRVFSWLICESFDDKGNAVVYTYAGENDANVDRSQSNERNRERSANRYPKRIQYGNRVSRLIEPNLTRAEWLFEVVFDYDGEGHYESLAPDPELPEANQRQLVRAAASTPQRWSVRPDPFSSYRAGFEVRTYRRCRRVLMFHRFDELGDEPYLVRSTEFEYADLDYSQPTTIEDELAHRGSARFASFIRAVTQSGFVRDANHVVLERPGARYVTYITKSLPPLEFEYSKATIQDSVRELDTDSAENLPMGLDGATYQWVDLDGEGVTGILTEQANTWFYKRNLGEGRFGPVEVVASIPSVANLNGGRQQLLDLAGNGQLDLVSFAGPTPGFYERTQSEDWELFKTFTSLPNIRWDDPNLRFVDLNGDGHADVLITENEVLAWYSSLAEKGFDSAQYVRKPFDEEMGPRLVLADGTQSIYLADMGGDGLADLVRIRNGEVCYWPNVGYGRFGARVTMDNSPWFDYPDQFSQHRIRLADIDGSGNSDIVYLGKDSVRMYFNQSGNRWSGPRRLSQFPRVDNLSSVMTADLFGNGTACLVWSSPLPGESHQSLRYIDLMGGQKPHLLTSAKNNLGAETRIKYAASTSFYLHDRAAGNPWITKLPFPVHVVERVEVYDHVSRTKLVTTFKYHHGYFDGPEREFRGFGMVERFDAESFSRFSGPGLFTETPDTEGEEFHLPPAHTKTWFHNGAYVGRNKISRHFESEYYQGDPLAKRLRDTILPARLTAQEEREACRSLKGKVLRQEIYADDSSGRGADPYSVVEHGYRIRVLQSQRDNQHAVFYPHDSEVLEYHYERNPHDPRISHQLTLEVDEFGNVTKSAAVAYPRRPQLPTPGQPSPPDHPSEQRQTYIVYSESDFTDKVDTESAYRTPLPCEVRTYELTQALRIDESELYTVNALLDAAAGATEIQYEDSPSHFVSQKRIIERVRTVYRKNDLSSPLPLRRLESLALPFESYKQAFTPGLLSGIYGGKLPPAELADLLSNEAAYRNLDADGVWWIPSGQVFFSPSSAIPESAYARAHFYLPQGSIDPFGNLSLMTHDDYDLLMIQTTDAIGNVVAAHHDYRVMQPDLVTDPNGNRTAVRFDTVGMVVATAVMGKSGSSEGDTLDDPTTRLEYNVFNWMRNGQPNFVHTFARERHGAANPRWQETFSYSDGLGREVMKKIQAEPGLAPQLNSAGSVIEVETSPAVRWVGTGRNVFDNKGNPVKKYEPFFSTTPEYETEERLARVGVTPILRYDPLGRLIRTDLPNGTFTNVDFDAWRQITYDENDTVRESHWYVERGRPDPTAREPTDADARAAWLAAKQAGTPAVAHLDSLGRTFMSVADNGQRADGTPQKFETRVELDVEGNQRSVTDARGNRVMEYAYDMLGTKIHQRSMDAGERWMLNNVVGHAICGWDSRGHTITTTYDRLQRPTHLFVREGAGERKLAERTVYGEPATDDPAADAEAKRLNLRGKVHQHYDGAGVVTNDAFDFKGNLLRGTRQFADEYRQQLDWSALPSPPMQAPFATSTTYDALNRPITLTMPDRSVVYPTFNEANLLERVSVNLRGAETARAFVTNIDYDAKGQRKSIEYRINDRTEVVRTVYRYDPLTFRMIGLTTTRTSDSALLQDLLYIYDPVGNITAIRDNAQQTIYFRNRRVEASAEYEYDALYRLTSATGREHLGQNVSGRLNPPQQINHDDSFRSNLLHLGDGNAMGNYTERYEYDAVGNILRMIHEAGSAGSWTRRYAYAADSNRLLRTSLPVDRDESYSAHYEYNEHGSMISMPHLPTITPDQPAMEWDFKDQLHKVRTQRVIDGASGETVYYVYDADGQRARKVIERPGGSIREERFYIGGFEVYRERGSDRVTLERETLHIMDDRRRIAMVETKTIDADAPRFTPAPLIRYQLGNHLGSASLELDGAGEIVSYEEYFPYGSTSYRAVRRGVEVSPKRYRYTGKERDEETGFYYHGARYYAPWLGRWTSCDPAGLVDGANLFAFVRGQPIRLIDVDGKQGARADLANRYATMTGGNRFVQERVAREAERQRQMIERVQNQAEAEANAQFRSQGFADYLNSHNVRPGNLGSARTSTELRFQILWNQESRSWLSTRIVQLSDHPAAEGFFRARYQSQSNQVAAIEWLGTAAQLVVTAAAAGATRWLARRMALSTGGALLTEAQGAEYALSIRQRLANRAQAANIAIFRSEIDGAQNMGWAPAGRRNPPIDPAAVPVPPNLPASAPGVISLGSAETAERAMDAERRILGTVLQQTTPQSTGRIVIYTERTMCGQCSQFVEEFRQARPRIDVQIIGGGPQGVQIPGAPVGQVNRGVSGFPYPTGNQ